MKHLTIAALLALSVAQPVLVSADDAGAVTTRVDGEDRGRLGDAGRSGRATYVVARGEG